MGIIAKLVCICLSLSSVFAICSSLIFAFQETMVEQIRNPKLITTDMASPEVGGIADAIPLP